MLLAATGFATGALAARPVVMMNAAMEMGEEACGQLIFGYGHKDTPTLEALAVKCNNASGSTCRIALKRTGADLSPFKETLRCPNPDPPSKSF